MKTLTRAFVSAFKIFFLFPLIGLTSVQSQTVFNWVKRLGGGYNFDRYESVVDNQGNIYSVGSFRFTADFDPGPGTFNLTSAGGEDAFVTKLDSNGNFIWAKRIGGSNISYSEGAFSVALDQDYNLYLTGQFGGTTDFDPSPAVFSVTSLAYVDCYILKLDSAGNFKWVKIIGSSDNELAKKILVDSNYDLYITGEFRFPTDFNPGPAVYTMNGNGQMDIFLLKLDSAGNFIWVKKFGGTDWDLARSIELDSYSNVFITGQFVGPADLDPGPTVFLVNSVAGSGDIFLVKLNPAGIFQWGKTIGGKLTDVGYSIAAENITGNIYLAGEFVDTADFDPGVGMVNMYSQGGGDIFVLKLDSSGNYLWAKTTGGLWADRAYSIDLDGLGRVYVSGIFSVATDLNPAPETYPLSSVGYYDGFILELDSSGNLDWVKHFGSIAFEYPYSILLGPNGNVYCTGIFQNTVDFDPGVGVHNLFTGTQEYVFVLKLIPCVPPVQPAPIIGSDTVCPGVPMVFSTQSNSDGNSYCWVLPPGWTGTSSDTSILVTPGSVSGIIEVRALSDCDSSIAQSIYVTVLPIPEMPDSISGDTMVCAGTIEIYAVPPASGAISYTWTFPSGWSGLSSDTIITLSAGTTSGNITVRSENGGCNSASRFLAVQIDSLPVLSEGILGPDTICLGLMEYFSIPPGSANYDYTWILPTGWSGASTTDSILISPGSLPDTLFVQGNNFCGTSSTQFLWISVDSVPDNPFSIIGDTQVCFGVTYTFGVPPVSGAISYLWSLPNGWTGSSTVDSIQTTVGDSSGNISVSSVNACGTSLPLLTALSVDSIPDSVIQVNGNSQVCLGEINTYFAQPVSGATLYLWNLPSGWSGSSMIDSIVSFVGPSSGNILATAGNFCGNASPYSFPVIVDSIPDLPGFILGDTSICPWSSNMYSIPLISNATFYNWTLPTGWAGSSGINTLNTTANTSGGLISVSAENYCGVSPVQSVSVTVPNLNAMVGGSAPVLTAIPAGSAYQWLNCPGMAIIPGEISQQFTPLVNGMYAVIIEDNSCTDTSDCMSVAWVGLANFSVQNNLLIYPNPSKGTLFFDNSKGDITRIEIWSTLGQMMAGFDASEFQNSDFDLSDWPSGFYFISFYTSSSIYTVSWVKQN